MQHISLVNEAKNYIATQLCPGQIAIDATVGNGFDTVFLAQQVGSTGKVYGFDIQSEALQATRLKLVHAALADRVELIHADHALAKHYINHQHSGKISAIMFNLGYLPGANKTLITQTETTLAALTSSLSLLDSPGMISIIAYPGHCGGDRETEAVLNWSKQLDQTRYKHKLLVPPNLIKKAPCLLIIMK